MSTPLQHLADRYATQPTSQHREAVTLAALPLVRSLVNRMNVPDHPLASREDLENVGMLGVLQALDGYDAAHGTPFISYAYGRIRGALVDYLRSIDALPRERRRRLARAQKARETLQQQCCGEPSDVEVAALMDMTLSEYHKLLTDAQRRFDLSLYSTTSADSEQAMLEVIPNEEADAAFEQIERDSLHAFVATLIRELPEREQNILALYFYENLKLREIAQILSLTEARISQILSKTLATLRARLASAHALAA